MCGHHNHMKRSVGSRELKTRLGTYLRRAREGQVLVVTDRGQPVAELRPVSGGAPEDSALAGLVARGALTLRRRSALVRFTPIPSSRTSLAAAISEGREDRF